MTETVFAGVRRVSTASGSHIEPPCDEGWDDLTKLQWEAAVTEIDTGLRVRVTAGGAELKRRGRWVPVRDSYSVSVGGSSVGSFSYVTAWTFLTGVSVGAREANRRKAS